VAALSRRAFLRGSVAAAGVVIGGAAVSVLGGCGLQGNGSGGAGAASLTLLGESGVASAPANLMPVAAALAGGYDAAAGAAAKGVARAAPAPSGLAGYMASLLEGAPPFTTDLMLTTHDVRDLLGAPSLMIDLDAAFQRTGLAAGIYPMVLAYCAPGGRQRMIPIFRDPLVVYYNADAFSRAGVDPPAADWTSANLLFLCGQLLTQSRGAVVPLANVVNVLDIELLAAFVEGYGGQMLAGSGNASVSGYLPRFAEPPAIQGIDALLRLHAFEPARPPAAPLALFAKGTAAMCFGHHRDVARLQAQIADLFAWGVAPLPRFPVRAAQPVRADGLAAVTRNPQRREAAIAVALYAATPDGQLAAARTGIGVPALRALAGSGTWRQAAPHLDNDVFVAQPEADIIVDPALVYIAPQLESAIRAVLAGAPVATTFGEASTAVEFTLQTWPNV